MDKQTLSSYGWIVVLVLILACLLAFASPFGMFVVDGIKSFAGGFVDTNNAAMEQVDPDAGKIPADQCSHENIELQNQKSASCSNNGYTGDKVCKDCGTKTETGTVTAKLNHTPVTDNAVPATCEQKGKTEGSHCSVCKTTLVAQREVDALGHDWGDPFVAEQATCLGNGISRIECQREGCDAHSDSSIKAEGHTPVVVKGKAATCTATGLTDGEKCSKCGTVIKAQTTIKALDHDIVRDNAVAATCTTTGLTAGEHCTRCNYKVAQTVVAAKGHTEVTDKAVEATCLTDGKSAGKHCSVCGTVTEKQSFVPALGHDIVKDNAVAATCTATGLTEGKHCSVCNAVLTAQTTVDALGHDIAKDNAIAATCTTTGLTEGKHCTRCDYRVAQTIVPVKGHTEVIDKAVPATCTATGLTEGKHCSVCNTVTVAQETVKALKHNIVKDEALSASCTGPGLTEGEHCTRCDYKVVQSTVPALGHDYVSVVTKKATCTETGIITYTCSRCGHSYTVTTSALGHTDVSPADNNCDRCGDVIKEVDGLGNVEVNNPNADITYNPDTGEAGGVIPPAEDEPEVPADIPEEKLPEFIEFNYGNFESNTTYTPGTYETVPYETTYTKVKYPVSYQGWIWSKWHITKVDNQIVSVVPFEITLADIDTKYSEYILYDFETDEYLEMEGVKGDSVYLWTIYDSSKDTKENIIYLAAYLNKLENNPNRHVAKWDGTKYVAVNYDAEIAAVDTFTETYTVKSTKKVQITAPSTSVDYVFVPVGTLKAEKGMTWAEWLASDYNTTGKTNPTIKTSTFADVSYDDVIKANESYGFFTATRLAPGLYQTGTSNLLYSWQELLDSGVIYLTDVAWYPKGVYVDNEIAWDEFNSLAGDLVLPDDGSIETLGFEGFAGADNMTSIVIPISVNKIEDGSLAGCTKLTKIIYEGSVADWSEIGKDQSWNSSVPATYVQCRDGNAPIS